MFRDNLESTAIITGPVDHGAMLERVDTMLTESLKAVDREPFTGLTYTLLLYIGHHFYFEVPLVITTYKNKTGSHSNMLMTGPVIEALKQVEGITLIEDTYTPTGQSFVLNVLHTHHHRGRIFYNPYDEDLYHALQEDPIQIVEDATYQLIAMDAKALLGVESLSDYRTVEELQQGKEYAFLGDLATHYQGRLKKSHTRPDFVFNGVNHPWVNILLDGLYQEASMYEYGLIQNYSKVFTPSHKRWVKKALDAENSQLSRQTSQVKTSRLQVEDVKPYFGFQIQDEQIATIREQLDAANERFTALQTVETLTPEAWEEARRTYMEERMWMEGTMTPVREAMVVSAIGQRPGTET